MTTKIAEPAFTIPTEEEGLLARVRQNLADQGGEPARRSSHYDADLVALRDEIGEARLEDVPALVAQMERLQGVAARRAVAQGALVDPRAPYFGHLRLREETSAGSMRERDVLIGRATYVDTKNGVRIVDWRHAPVSQLYYRYNEGSPYEERFGDRDVEGEVVLRRTVTISKGTLVRIASPQGNFVRTAEGSWRHLEPPHAELAGGQGTATRPSDVARGVLGVADDEGQRIDRHLPEIAALIDPRQFELITLPDSGLVVIQGGAGSGKTTIGLHRMAYLAYAAPRKFTADRMLVVTYGEALAAYIGEVLPSLGVEGVSVVTFPAWAKRERRKAIPWLIAEHAEDTPGVVTRLKKHPSLLRLLEERAEQINDNPSLRRDTRAVVNLWAETLTDLPSLLRTFGPESGMTESDVKRAHQWCSERCFAVLEQDPGEQDLGETSRPDDDDIRGDLGIDGLRTDEERAQLDVEDDAILLRATQLLRGPLRRGKKASPYAHLFVDEAQDLAPIELAVLIEQTTAERSVTLAGDTSQRLYLDNGFRDWNASLQHLRMTHVAVEPLRLAYRSTKEILEVARHAMGHLADPTPPVATRSGAPVEAHIFPEGGAAVAFLGDALRTLFVREPRATVAVLARYPEQSDTYFTGLRFAEVPFLRRVRAQDFSFRPGVEVTEIRQVKGLEFDYVILVDVNASTFGTDDESRHLFHIAATRAAHQLWLVVTSPAPSALIPPQLLGY